RRRAPGLGHRGRPVRRRPRTVGAAQAVAAQRLALAPGVRGAAARGGHGARRDQRPGGPGVGRAVVGRRRTSPAAARRRGHRLPGGARPAVREPADPAPPGADRGGRVAEDPDPDPARAARRGGAGAGGRRGGAGPGGLAAAPARRRGAGHGRRGGAVAGRPRRAAVGGRRPGAARPPRGPRRARAGRRARPGEGVVLMSADLSVGGNAGAPPYEVVVGVDVGTTAAKVSAFGLGAPWRHTAVREYPLLHPRPGWEIQQPGTVMAATLAALTDTVEACR